MGQRLDFLGMCACLMATAEVAYQLRDCVDVVTASEGLVPGYSWPFDLIFSGLRSDPSQTAAALSRSVVRLYTDYYTKHPPKCGDVTLVALELARIIDLTAALDALAAALLDEMATQATVLWDAQAKAENKETVANPAGCKDKATKFTYHLWDLGTLATNLAADPSATSAVKDAAQAVHAALSPPGRTVLAEGHRGDWFDGTGGVSIYLMKPDRSGTQRLSSHYRQLALAADTRWNEMLQAYHKRLGLG